MKSLSHRVSAPGHLRDCGLTRSPSAPRWALLTIASLAALPAVQVQEVGVHASSAQGDEFRAQGRFLRGMAWYELKSAEAASLNAETLAAWNRAVQAEYNQYLLDRANRIASRKAIRNERQQEAAARLAEARRRWRENPTVDDIRSGVALNALAGDLADPAIPVSKWRAARVELPQDVSIQSLSFRFADAPSYKLPIGMRPSTVAIGRMKVNGRWPIALRRRDLERQRAAYQRAIAAAIKTCVANKPLRAGDVDAVRDNLLALREKATEVMRSDAALAKQARVFLDQLDEATKIFLDRDFAEELIRDVEDHQAQTVAELLGFMKKYRLVFADADEAPEAWATYKTLYDLLKRQKIALDFADITEDSLIREKAAR
jgi:hypothetical protein